MTPEECSAEVLRALYGYLPEEIRGDGDTGTVITVPAAFNQMQKDSTMAAADAAGLGRVALMQEPVAAVMSVMRQRKNDGVFVRSEEHTSELQSLMRISYAVFCLKKKKKH